MKNDSPSFYPYSAPFFCAANQKKNPVIVHSDLAIYIILGKYIILALFGHDGHGKTVANVVICI